LLLRKGREEKRIETKRYQTTPHTPNTKPNMWTELEVVLDDLCSRFLINCPEEEYESLERICFQIEQAHWFYEDFYREKNPRLPSLSLKEFTRQSKYCIPDFSSLTSAVLWETSI